MAHCVVLLAIFVTIISVGSFLRCYDCSHGTPVKPEDVGKGKSCDDPDVVECKPKQICTKMEVKLNILGEEIKTIPSCGDVETCKFFDKDGLKCYACDTDLCNSSSKLSSPAIVLVLFFMFKYFM